MSIRFETTIDHLVAFNRFHYENSPLWRKQRLVQSLVVPVAAGVLIWIFAAGIGDPLQLRGPNVGTFAVYGLTLLLLAVGVGSFFFVRWRIKRNLEWSVRKLLTEGSNRAVLGRCDMTLADNRLVVKREWIDSSIDMRAIQKIAQTDEYAFVYISSVNAIVIPMNLFPEDEYRDFVADLLDAWENRDAPRPTEAPDERIRSTKRS